MTGYDARDAAGFIRVFGLPTRGRYRIDDRQESRRHAARR